MLKTKLKFTIPREFPGFWCLFRLQQASRYGARLDEERRRWTIMTLDCFRFATLKIVAVKCYVGLDMIIFYPAIILLCKQLLLIGAAILFLGHPYIWARYCELIIIYRIWDIFFIIEHMQPLKWDMQSIPCTITVEHWLWFRSFTNDNWIIQKLAYKKYF